MMTLLNFYIYLKQVAATISVASRCLQDGTAHPTDCPSQR